VPKGKDTIVVHHAAGPRSQDADTIKKAVLSRLHQPAYAKIIEADGQIKDFAGETATDVAHAKGFNTRGIGVCLAGFFDSAAVIAKTAPYMPEGYPGDVLDLEDPQGKALVYCLVVLCERHNIAPSRIIGHVDTFDLLGVKREKSCPGAQVHALLGKIRKRVTAELAKRRASAKK